jgi:hypothetical protein
MASSPSDDRIIGPGERLLRPGDVAVIFAPPAYAQWFVRVLRENEGLNVRLMAVHRDENAAEAIERLDTLRADPNVRNVVVSVPWRYRLQVPAFDQMTLIADLCVTSVGPRGKASIMKAPRWLKSLTLRLSNRLEYEAWLPREWFEKTPATRKAPPR